VSAYYNERDPYAARWLENLISAGLVAEGVVDSRDIREIRPTDLRSFTQYHFFAGIGVWSYVLRRAGWSDDRPVWTGSCPCQPFSGAGRREGFNDERHLWPAWFELIRECRPDVLFGEQVANGDGLKWLDLVCDNLEDEDYAVGAVDTCAAGMGAPHIRQRLYWMALANGRRRQAGQQTAASLGYGNPFVSGGYVREMADTNGARLPSRECAKLSGQDRNEEGRAAEQSCCSHMRLADSVHAGRSKRRPFSRQRQTARGSEPDYSNATNDYWRAADWLFGTDGKWRPVESGTFPLAHGVAGRVGQLRAYGNALCAPQAEAFVRAAIGAITFWFGERSA
jgi:DNA (cytosine-5)-methyltransferase 1